MIQLPDENHLEWILLGDLHGYLQASDRRPDGIAPIDCDPISGLPLDHAPKEIFVQENITINESGEPVYTPAHTRMTTGSLVLPKAYARGGLALAGEMTLWSGGDDPGGGPGTPGLAGDHLFRVKDGRKTALSMIPRSDWTPEEIAAWREYAYRIRKIFRLWATMGLVDPAPIIFESPERPGLDGLPRVVRPTWKLIDLARQKIPGTRYANRPKSILHALTPEQRASQPAYAQASYAEETGGSVSAPLTDNTKREESTCFTPFCSAAEEVPTSSRTTPPTPEASASDSKPPASPGSD